MAEVNPLDALLGASINVEEKVYIKRLGANFTVRALTGARVNDLREQCTYSVGKGAKQRMVIREEELAQLLIAESCVEPDFNNPKLQEKYGAHDAASCIQRALLAGEVEKLSSAVLDASGFNYDDDDVEEVKN